MPANPAVAVIVSQGQVLAASVRSVDLRVTQGVVLSAIQHPSELLNIYQGETKAAVKSSLDLHVTQASVLVAVRGRVENRRLRAWPMKLDGHDLFVLRLGERETLVYDKTTERWSKWTSLGLNFWRAHVGQNWLGAGQITAQGGYGTNIVAGDDTYGLLWIIDTENGYDENPQDGSASVFTRKVVGGLPMRGRSAQPCSAVYLTASLGSPAIEDSLVTLRLSDDKGHTWFDQGSVTVMQDDYQQELSWWSLGSMVAPGRVFEISDDGALARIDSLDMLS